MPALILSKIPGGGDYKSYNKPKNVPHYVLKLSNHPLTVLRNLPIDINKRLSSISSNEKVFKQATSLFQKAIEKSGYDFQLKFDPKAKEKKPKNRNRKRDALWFNPPYNSTVSTDFGGELLKLLDELSPSDHKLRKAFNSLEFGIWKRKKSFF